VEMQILQEQKSAAIPGGRMPGLCQEVAQRHCNAAC
jgi:hypothetical protein